MAGFPSATAGSHTPAWPGKGGEQTGRLARAHLEAQRLQFLVADASGQPAPDRAHVEQPGSQVVDVDLRHGK